MKIIRCETCGNEAFERRAVCRQCFGERFEEVEYIFLSLAELAKAGRNNRSHATRMISCIKRLSEIGHVSASRMVQLELWASAPVFTTNNLKLKQAA